MAASIDRKVTGDFLSAPECKKSIERYYQINRDFHSDVFACGRVTMEGSFTGGWKPDYSAFADASVPLEDFIFHGDAGFFAVAFDRRGRLGWKTGQIEGEDQGYGGAHIVEILCEDTVDAHLSYLRSADVSYIFAGKLSWTCRGISTC